jgi:hypothetical protein
MIERSLRSKFVHVLDSYGIDDDPELYPGFELMVDDLIYEVGSVLGICLKDGESMPCLTCGAGL